MTDEWPQHVPDQSKGPMRNYFRARAKDINTVFLGGP